ncbi:MAG: hypothetical protein KJZ75_00520 [Hyphomonadaceae bacterium]|nr:hypothetical protein [Hyphomonadaceae bacterium]GIK49282.1 MAG: hypothetical protein BroJett013_19790 [Alphaproteobacteria bacterium]
MKLYSYVVARDYGFAPNPFFAVCSLATCKPRIRKTAKVGDWVVGTGSAANGRAGSLVFVMRVSEAMTFDDYWNDQRFRRKRPRFDASRRDAFGDNIYHQSHGGWTQEKSHHSHPDGSPNKANIDNDTQTNRVLLGTEFAYWGDSGPKIPAKFRSLYGYDLCAGRGHKSAFSTPFVSAFESWFYSTSERGQLGRPLDWKRTP